MATRLRSAFAVLIQYAVTLALLFLGWGLDDLRSFFVQPARFGLLLLILLGALIVLVFFPGLQPFHKGKQVVGRWLAVVWMAVGFFLLWFLPFGDRRGLLVFANAEALRYIGLGLGMGGGTLRVAALTALGRQFSGYVTVQENHRLVQTGIYSVIRHPMYLGVLLSMPGFGLVFRSWLTIPILILSAIFVAVRIHQEEKLLQQHFGADFDAYRRRTWRLLPFLY